MYLVMSSGLLQWVNIDYKSPDKLIEEGVDLELIEGWQKAERSVLPSDIEVALRFGFPVRSGIVVDALYVTDQRRPYDLREAYENARDAANHPQIKATDEFIDTYRLPGWKKAGEDLDRKIDQGNRESVREALEKAKSDLEAPMKEDLVAHWRSLGGHVPE